MGKAVSFVVAGMIFSLTFISPSIGATRAELNKQLTEAISKEDIPKIKELIGKGAGVNIKIL